MSNEFTKHRDITWVKISQEIVLLIKSCRGKKDGKKFWIFHPIIEPEDDLYIEENKVFTTYTTEVEQSGL